MNGRLLVALGLVAGGAALVKRSRPAAAAPAPAPVPVPPAAPESEASVVEASVHENHTDRRPGGAPVRHSTHANFSFTVQR